MKNLNSFILSFSVVALLSTGLSANNGDEPENINFEQIATFTTKAGEVELPLSQVYAIFIRHRLHSSLGIQVENVTMENDNQQAQLVGLTVKHSGKYSPIKADQSISERICNRLGMKLVADSTMVVNNFDSNKSFEAGRGVFYRTLKTMVILNSKLEVESVDEVGASVSASAGKMMSSFSCRY